MRAVRWVVLMFMLACSGGRSEGPPVERAFYFWRTTFELSPAERNALADARVTKLYVRAFDLDETGQVVGRLTVVDRPPAGIEIVPVVFLRQELFHQAHDPRALAERTWREVGQR